MGILLRKKFIKFLVLFSLAWYLTSCTQNTSNPKNNAVDKSNVNVSVPTKGMLDHKHPTIVISSPGLPKISAQPTGKVEGSVKVDLGKLDNSNSSEGLAVQAENNALEMKILIITALATDYVLETLEALLKGVGIPYDVLVASQQDLTLKQLTSNGIGHYQAIFLTTGSLAYNTDGGVWDSAFTAEEWNILWQYERDFKVRQVAMYSYPSAFPEDFGLILKEPRDTSSTPLDITLTSKGKEFFSALQANVTIPVQYAYTYLSTVNNASAGTVTPLLEDSAGNVVAVLGVSPDGRERINLTMGHNPYLLHTQLLGYDLLRWATQGVFIGERRLHLNIDEDDLYLESDVWNPATLNNWAYEDYHYRISGKDLLAVRDQVKKLRQAYPLASNLKYVHAFNAHKGDPNAVRNCSANASLSAAVLCTKNFFGWVNHTWSHPEMDFKTYQESTLEFNNNIDFANNANLNHDKESVVTGKHSGLGWFRVADAPAGATCQYDQIPTDEYCQFGLEYSNKEMLRAAKDLGIKYMAANRGWLSHVAKCDSCGIKHPLEPSILLIPRWPTNIFYNVTNPNESTSEFNHFYNPAFFNYDLTYEEILDLEANTALYHILTFSPYPHFFHQNNLREYTPGKSLIYDWTNAVLEKYSKYLNTPIISQKWPAMTKYVEYRTSFFDSGASGIWDRSNNTVNVSTSNGGTIFITGAQISTTMISYGQDKVSRFTLNANNSKSGVVVSELINNNPPIINTINDQNNFEGDNVSLAVVANDTDGDTLTYLAAGLPQGLAINSQTGNISGVLANETAGEYNVVISVTDGTVTVSHYFMWVIAPVNLKIDISKQSEGPDSRTVNSGSSIDFTITVTNTGNVDLTNIEVTDPLTPNCARTKLIGNAIAHLAANGGKFEYTCTANNITKTFTNIATAKGNYETTNATVTDEDSSTVNVIVPTETKYCVSNNTSWELALYIEDIESPNTNHDHIILDSSTFHFVEKPDNTATLTGDLHIDSGDNKGFKINMSFSEKTTNGIPEFSANVPQGSDSDWYYYSSYNGVFTGTGDYQGLVLNVDDPLTSEISANAQIGTGANLVDKTDFGMYAWMGYLLAQQGSSTNAANEGEMGFHLKLSPCPPN